MLEGYAGGRFPLERDAEPAHRKGNAAANSSYGAASTSSRLAPRSASSSSQRATSWCAEAAAPPAPSPSRAATPLYSTTVLPSHEPGGAPSSSPSAFTSTQWAPRTWLASYSSRGRRSKSTGGPPRGQFFRDCSSLNRPCASSDACSMQVGSSGCPSVRRGDRPTSLVRSEFL